MATPRRDAQPRAAGELRERIVAGNQLFLCAVVGVLFVVGVASGSLGDAALAGTGVLLIVVGGIAALAVPWSRLRPSAAAVIPIADIIAIGLLREANPAAGVGLLWAFPAMWLASFGRVGLAISCIGIPVFYWVLLALGPAAAGTTAAALLPVVIIAITATSYSAARRYDAQRRLLDLQSERSAAAHREALRQEQLVTEVLDTVDFGVVRLAESGRVVLENDALSRFREIAGLDPDEVATAALTDEKGTPLPAEDHPMMRLRRGEAFDDDVAWFNRPGGARTAVSFTGRRLTDHNGAPAGAVLIARDITAERDAQRARDDLVASVSHELRTPLTSILGYLDLALEGGGLSEQARRQVDTAYRNSERLLGIVTDILSASSRSSASIDTRLHQQPVDVAELARTAVASLMPLAEERYVTIVLDLAGSAEAYADPARLRQVIDNLLANAIKFNRDGGLVTARTRTDGVHTVIEVEDTGIGMDAESAARVFDRFFRAADTVPGNGLGLSITRDLVRAHGGTISVASQAGVGSTFTVVLPATRQVFELDQTPLQPDAQLR